MFQSIQFKMTILNPICALSLQRGLVLIPMLLACFGLPPAVRAVTPPPDGGYPGYNTAEGTNALFSLAGGVFNTALGGQALKDNTTGNNNTAVGLNALLRNATGNENVAVGQGALGNNTTGIRNVAVGFQALNRNTTAGNASNGVGWQALFKQTTGQFNNGFGWAALYNNVTGTANTAMGDGAGSQITGDGNVCVGASVAGVAGEN